MQIQHKIIADNSNLTIQFLGDITLDTARFSPIVGAIPNQSIKNLSQGNNLPPIVLEGENSQHLICKTTDLNDIFNTLKELAAQNPDDAKWVNVYMLNDKLYTSRRDFRTYISPIRRITPLIAFLSNHENKEISNKIINTILNYVDIRLIPNCDKDTINVSKMINALSKFKRSKTIEDFVDAMCRKMNPTNSICEGSPTQVIELLDGLANFSNSSDVCVCKFVEKGYFKTT